MIAMLAFLVGRLAGTDDGDRRESHAHAGDPSAHPASSVDRHTRVRSTPATSEKDEVDLAEILGSVMASRTGRLTITVVDEATGDRIDGRSTCLLLAHLPNDSVQELRLEGDSGGRIEADGVPYPCVYDVRLSNDAAGVAIETNFVMERNGHHLQLAARRRTIVTGRAHDDKDRNLAKGRAFLVVAPYEKGPGGGGGAAAAALDAGIDADGGFRFSIDVPHGPLKVGAFAAGHDPAWGTLTRRTDYLYEADVALERGALVRVRVTDSAGNPVQGALVRVGALRHVSAASAETDDALIYHAGGAIQRSGLKGSSASTQVITMDWKTTGDGTIDAGAPLPAEQFFVVVSRDNARPYSSVHPGPFSAGAVIDLGTIRLDDEVPTSELRIAYRDGSPAAGVAVQIQVADIPSHLQLNSPSMTADSNGVVRTRFLEQDRVYRVFVSGGRLRNRECIEGVVAGPDGAQAVLDQATSGGQQR